MVDVPRIGPEEAYEKVTAGEALLVCGYEDPEQCAALHVEGSLSMQQFRALRRTLPKEQELVFYCD